MLSAAEVCKRRRYLVIMEKTSGPKLMTMYEDESVYLRFADGTELQLSPCGSEFMVVKNREPVGPSLLPPERVLQRTRFTISAFRDLIITALAFRNKYASQPYLPEELIPAAHKQPFISTDSDVRWPEVFSSEAKLGPRGETTVSSEDGRAALLLLPSGEEFSLQFTCRLSQPHHQILSKYSSRDADSRPDAQKQHADDLTHKGDSSRDNASETQLEGKKGIEQLSLRSSSQNLSGVSHCHHPQPEQRYQTTKVVQHHSGLAVPPTWRYPLSLAQHHRAAHPLKSAHDVGADKASEYTSNIPIEDRQSLLPQALPLTCQSPHRHRWRLKDPFSTKEHSDQESSAELVKVMWCKGVTYRILMGAVPAIEVSTEDGSVIRSNGVLNTYFTHYKPDLQSMGLNVKVVTYHLSSLPPDVSGQVYSIRSVLSCAHRMLTCYNESKQSLKLHSTPSCLQEDIFSKPVVFEETLQNPVPAKQRVNDTPIPESHLDLVATELEKIKRFNFLLEKKELVRCEKLCIENTMTGETHKPVSERNVAEALHRTSKAIQDIDALISAATLK